MKTLHRLWLIVVAIGMLLLASWAFDAHIWPPNVQNIKERYLSSVELYDGLIAQLSKDHVDRWFSNGETLPYGQASIFNRIELQNLLASVGVQRILRADHVYYICIYLPSFPLFGINESGLVYDEWSDDNILRDNKGGKVANVLNAENGFSVQERINSHWSVYEVKHSR